MCGAPWTVAPQRYSPTWPARRGTSSRMVREAVSNKRSVTAPGYRRASGALDLARP